MIIKALETPIEFLKGVGSARAEILKKELQISKFKDLLNYYPYKYIDRTRFYKINAIQQELPYVQLIVRVRSKDIIGKKQARRLVVKAVDDTGEIELVWFQGIKWVDKLLIVGKAYIIFGKPGFFNNKLQIAHAEIEEYTAGAIGRTGNSTLQPAYNTTEKLKQYLLDTKSLQKLVAVLFEQYVRDIPENLPIYIISKFKLTSRFEALYNIHFPADSNILYEAKRRLKFEELFFFS